MNSLNYLISQNADSSTSIMLMVVSISLTLGIVYAFKIFVKKSQMEFRDKFEAEGYNFDYEWIFPAGIIEADSEKNVLWVSTHGNKIININEITELRLIKSTFEISNIYIKTKKEILKYPISSSRRTSKTKLDEQNQNIEDAFADLKRYIDECKNLSEDYQK